MKTAHVTKLSLAASLALASTAMMAQRNGPDWNTAGFDVQRSHWMKADKDVTSASVAKQGFELIWKQKIDGVKVGLSEPIIVGTFIGWKGFKDLVLFQDGTGNLYVYDSDLGVPYFDKRFNNTSAAKPCALASIGAPGRPSLLEPAAAMTRPGASPYHSVIGKPDEGVPGGMNPQRFGRPPGATQPEATPGLNQGGRAATPMYTVTADGTLHIMAHGTGNEYEKPTPFVPAGSAASDISSVNKVVYVATLPGCGASPNTLFAMDRTDPAKPVVKQWKPESGNILGAPAFSTGGNLYVTTTKQMAALDPKTLNAKVMSNTGFASTPMIFTTADKKEYVAAGTADGKLVVMDAGTGAVVASAGEEQKTPFMPTAMATWDAAGTRYILVTDKTKQKAPVVAYTFSGGRLQTAWTTTELEAPGNPLVLNGVVFVLATGEQRGSADPADRAKGKPAVLYAYDGKTGKALWNSGTAIAAAVTTSGIATGSGMLYLADSANTIYAFGFPQERQ